MLKALLYTGSILCEQTVRPLRTRILNIWKSLQDEKFWFVSFMVAWCREQLDECMNSTEQRESRKFV
jgi:hypothetical protein